MFAVLVVFHVIVAVILIGVVLLQPGKGGGVAAAFGMGGTQSLFGARGTVDFLAKATWVLAGLFMLTSFSLAALSGAGGAAQGPRESLIRKAAQSTPVAAPPSMETAPPVDGGSLPPATTPVETAPSGTTGSETPSDATSPVPPAPNPGGH